MNAASDTWAATELTNNNNSWLVRIPKAIAPGNYVLRHEIIALHAAGNPDGAQSYPFCFNLAISGNGTDNPKGVLATELYKATDPGIHFNLFGKRQGYQIPGVRSHAQQPRLKGSKLTFSFSFFFLLVSCLALLVLERPYR